jgi:hypothetical protein
MAGFLPLRVPEFNRMTFLRRKTDEICHTRPPANRRYYRNYHKTIENKHVIIIGMFVEALLRQLLGCACIFRDGLSRFNRLEDCAVRKNGIMGSFF